MAGLRVNRPKRGVRRCQSSSGLSPISDPFRLRHVVAEARMVDVMSGSCDAFVHSQNLLNFRRRLASATDEAECRLLRKLLFEEECKGRRPNGRKPDDRRKRDDE